MRRWHCVTGFLVLLAVMPGWSADGQRAVPVTNATVVEALQIVRITPAGRPTERPAAPGDKIQGDDLLRTGGDRSKVLVRFNTGDEDRLGKDSLFSFSAETGRLNLSLSKGLHLYSGTEGFFCETPAFKVECHSTAVIEVFEVKGKSGKTNRYAAKLILLEGKATVVSLDGEQKRCMRGGEMILQFADEPVLAEPQEVDVKRLLRESRIVTGFRSPLPSMSRIQAVIDRQQRELWRGTLERTGLTIGGRGAKQYQETSPAMIDLEAPFDPDILGGAKNTRPPCPTCP